jgi:hypothetical protein
MFRFFSITFAWTQYRLRSKCLLHQSWVIFYCLFSLVILSQQASAQNTLHITKALIVNGRELTPTNEAKPINLPHSWNSESPQKEGIATYHISFSVTAGEDTDTLAVYMPRIGSRYEIYVNKELILSTGKLDDIRTFYTHKAGFVKIPTKLIFAGSNHLTIVIAGEGGRYAGLSSVYIGNYEQLSKQYESRTFYQTFTSLVIVIVCLFIGLVTLLYSVFTKNKCFLMFGIASLAWAANNSYLLLSYFPFNHRILLFFYDFIQAIGVALMCITVVHLVRIRVKWYASFAYGYIYFSFFCLIIYNDGHPIARAFF